MTFMDDILGGLSEVLEEAGETFAAELSGVPIKSFLGLFDEAVEVAEPYDTERVTIRPALTLLSSEFAGLDRNNTFRRSATDTLYKIYGDPQPDGMGLTRLYLVKA